jgi:hypothetical protein
VFLANQARAYFAALPLAVKQKIVFETDWQKPHPPSFYKITKSHAAGCWGGLRGGSGDAHGHGPYPITNGERTLLSAWLKQGRDWLML